MEALTDNTVAELIVVNWHVHCFFYNLLRCSIGSAVYRPSRSNPASIFFCGNNYSPFKKHLKRRYFLYRMTAVVGYSHVPWF